MSQVMRPAREAALVLASTSPWRAALLQQLSLPFSVASPSVDESPWQDGSLTPEQMVQALAREKALAVARQLAEGWVIGSDQAVSLDGQLFTKPQTAQEAVAQLLRLQGRTHTLHCGVCIVDAATGVRHEGVECHSLTLHPWERATLEAYVEKDRPLGCAGGYRLEGLGVALFSDVQGRDSTSIVGLPLMLVAELLRKHGLEVLL